MKYGFDNGPRYIEREVDGIKTKIILTWEDQELLRKQEWYSLAVNAIENYCEDADTILEGLEEEDLLEIGEAIEERTFRDNGEKEWSVLEQFDLVR